MTEQESADNPPEGGEHYFAYYPSRLRFRTEAEERALERRRAELLRGRGAAVVTLPAGCVSYASAYNPDEAREPTDLATSGEVVVPAGSLLSLGLDGADEHADALDTLKLLPPDVLGMMAVRGTGARSLRRLATLDWPALMAPLPGSHGQSQQGLRLDLATPDLAPLAAGRWPSVLQLVLPAGAAAGDGVAGLLLPGVCTLVVETDGPVDALLARLPDAAPDVRMLVLGLSTLEVADWTPLRGLGSLETLMVYQPGEPSGAAGGGTTTALLQEAAGLPGLRELEVHTDERVGVVDFSSGSDSLELLSLGHGLVDPSTVLATPRLPRLQRLSLHGVADDVRVQLMTLIARDGVLPGLTELNLYGDVMAEDDDDPESVLDAEDALTAARRGLSFNGLEFAPSVLAASGD